jgi:large subunit ribosomal protein L9
VKVILQQEVDNVGLAGDVVEVADGYGRNYLLPRGLAIPATRGALKQAEVLTRSRRARESRTMGTAEAFRAALEARALRVPVRVDERGHLYGSVSAADVARVLKERGHDVERRRIDLRQPIKQIGSYTIAVKIHPQVSAEVPIEVVDVEGAVTEESILAAKAQERSSLEDRAVAAADEQEQQPVGEEQPTEAAPAEDEVSTEVVEQEATAT